MPVAGARHFAHGCGDRRGGKPGAFIGRGFGRCGHRQARHRLTDAFKRKQAVKLVGVARRPGKGVLRLGGTAAAHQRQARPIQALGLQPRAARSIGIAAEQRGRSRAIMVAPQCGGATQPCQRRVIIAYGKALLADILAGGKGIGRAKRNPRGGVGIPHTCSGARRKQQFGNPVRPVERLAGQDRAHRQVAGFGLGAAQPVQFARALKHKTGIGVEHGGGQGGRGIRITAGQCGKPALRHRTHAGRCPRQQPLRRHAGACPQQCVDPRVVVGGHEPGAPIGQDCGLRRIAHHSAAPGGAGHLGRLWPAQRAQRQRIVRAARIGQRGKPVKIGGNGRWLRRLDRRAQHRQARRPWRRRGPPQPGRWTVSF